MTTNEPQTRQVVVGAVSVNRLLMLAGAVCFVIAALIAGSVVSGPDLAWAFGGFAAWSLAWGL